MKLLSHIVPSAAAICSGAVVPTIAAITSAYRKSLDEHYGKDHGIVNDRLMMLSKQRVEKQR
jgi:hypothetical protein